MEKIHFTTDDGVKIVGNYWQGVGERGIALFHMMPAAKESWNAIAERLNAEGFDVLAIDLRGHGESTSLRTGGKLDYKAFSDEEHRDTQNDVLAACSWLSAKGLQPENIYVAGASIGANLALEYMSEHLECPGGFLLSPGIDYRGIEAVPLAERLAATQRVYIAAAKDDTNISGAEDQAKLIFDAAAADKVLKILETGGHGTDMLEAHKELFEEIVGWLLADIRD